MVDRLYERWVRAAFRRPFRSLALLSLALVPAVVLTVALFQNIDTRVTDLLPPSSQEVKAFSVIARSMSEKSSVLVIARSPDPEANRAFIRELGQRLDRLDLPQIGRVRYDVSAERDWIYRRAPLLLDGPAFEDLASRAEKATAEARARANPLLIHFDDDPPPFDWEPIRTTIRERTARSDRYPRGYLETPDGKVVVAVVWLVGTQGNFEVAERVMAAIGREADAVRAHYRPDLEVGYNGETADLVEEHHSIVADLSVSSVAVLLLVGGAISLYFRSARALAASVLAIVPGLLATFALGRLTVHTLNSNTAFLGSILAGNGINTPLILLAFYRRQSPEIDPIEAFMAAARQGVGGTLGAAATASAAFGGLALSHFRGFSQFGWLGGLGMITIWAVTFATLPVMVALFDPPRAVRADGPAARALRAFFARPRLTAWAAGAALLLLVVGVAAGIRAGYRSGVYENHLRALRDRESLAHGSASWDAKMNEVFGVWLNPVVGISAEGQDREVLASRLRHALMQGKDPLAARVDTIESFVPAPEEQERRLSRLRRLASAYRAGRDKVPADLQELFDRWFRPESLTAITAAEVPESLRESFQEKSGRSDRAVLLYPSLAIDYDDTGNVFRFADQVKSVQLPEGAVVGGTFVMMAEVLRQVQEEALPVILFVALLSCLALLPILGRRPWRIPFTVITTTAVAFASQSIMLALGTRVNLLNFAAIAITIGVGSDYMVNLLGAMDALQTDLRGACARMGGAIFLCSVTTVIGYLSLVLAGSGMLRSFGWSAVLGEIVAITVVLLVLPAASGMGELRSPTTEAAPS